MSTQISGITRSSVITENQSVPTGANSFSTVTGQSTSFLTSLASSITGSVTGSTSFTTTRRCEEIEVIDETVSKRITVIPDVVSETEKVLFQVTSGVGVSFPADVLKPTIVVNFDELTEIQSITIPRHGNKSGNVEQFEVNFYSITGSPLNDRPILSSSSSEQDETNPAQVHSTQIPAHTLVSRVAIDILSTTDGKSPTSVMLQIKSCTKPRTGEKNHFINVHV